MQGYIVVFPYGGTLDRLPLKGLGVVDDVRCVRGVEEWHVKPVCWSQGSPLPKWVTAGSVVVLNAETPAFASVS